MAVLTTLDGGLFSSEPFPAGAVHCCPERPFAFLHIRHFQLNLLERFMGFNYGAGSRLFTHATRL